MKAKDQGRNLLLTANRNVEVPMEAPVPVSLSKSRVEPRSEYQASPYCKGRRSETESRLGGICRAADAIPESRSIVPALDVLLGSVLGYAKTSTTIYLPCGKTGCCTAVQYP